MDAYEAAAKKRTVKQLLTGVLFLAVIIGGWLYPLLGYFIPLCMLAGVGLAAFKGRVWCDWACPRGGFYDGWMRKVSPQRGIPPVLKTFYFRLGALLVLMAVMTVNLIVRWFDPLRIGKLFVTLLTGTTTLGIILAVIFHQRSWCAFCPIGTVSRWIGKRRTPLYINAALCVDCKRCAQVCPIQIRPHAFKEKGTSIVKDGDCLKCNLCVAVCPKRALSRT